MEIYTQLRRIRDRYMYFIKSDDTFFIFIFDFDVEKKQSEQTGLSTFAYLGRMTDHHHLI